MELQRNAEPNKSQKATLTRLYDIKRCSGRGHRYCLSIFIVERGSDIGEDYILCSIVLHDALHNIE